ncbi:MAG: GerMN domain-containing protein [Oscillospiraceae bacterium]|nr:GerMN domain-containing protein [Oscillospiraceae bacterium]
MKKTAVWLLLAALLLALASGCHRAGQEEEQGLMLWFPTDPDQERLSAALDSCPYQGESPSIPGLLAALLAGPPPESSGLVPAIPAGTRVLSWSLGNRVVDVELSAAYAELVGIDLTLADYCITLTLTQLPGVDGVRITANGGGQSYRDRQALYPEDVLFSGAEEVPVEVTAALYFRREGGDSLGYELRTFRLTEDKVPAKAVLTALIAGPEDKGLVPLLPNQLTVRSAWVDEGICIADLSAHLLDIPEEERALAMESIVETLRSLDTVDQVQILIEGEPAEESGRPDTARQAGPSE